MKVHLVFVLVATAYMASANGLELRELEIPESDESEPRKCDAYRCMFQCRASGNYGHCKTGHCVCTRPKFDEVFQAQHEHEKLTHKLIQTESDEIEPRKCDAYRCMFQCRASGNYGHCKTGHCVCTRPKFDEVFREQQKHLEMTEQLSETESDEAEPRKCDAYRCMFQCRVSGCVGYCQKGHCKCFRLHNVLLMQAETDKVTNQVSSTARRHYPVKCKKEVCDKECRRRRYNGGKCLWDACKCNVRPI